MDVYYDFECDSVFYKIGDEINVVFYDGTHCYGILEDIRVTDREIVVEGISFALVRIKEVQKLN